MYRWFQGVNKADVDCQSQENPTARPNCEPSDHSAGPLTFRYILNRFCISVASRDKVFRSAPFLIVLRYTPALVDLSLRSAPPRPRRVISKGLNTLADLHLSRGFYVYPPQ